MFAKTSRVMLIAPHPDDEALACSVLLQHAVHAGSAVRVVYATDGEDNPWPQRVVLRKWRLDATDRKRWAKLRRAEALAALRVLGVNGSSARFLALPDQKLTTLLICDCRSIVQRLAGIIIDWAPTDLFVPSISDTHPDHSALAVMLRLTLSEFFSDDDRMFVWSYAVHGRSPVFFDRAQTVRQSAIEVAAKLRAIRCHKTQLRLSKKRFLGYAARPERFLKLAAREQASSDGPIASTLRQQHSLYIRLQFSPKAIPTTKSALLIVGCSSHGTLRCASLQLPAYSSQVEMFDYATRRRFHVGRYCGDGFVGELTIPIDIFSPVHALFIKLTRHSWFFDEAGWLEIPGEGSQLITAQRRQCSTSPPCSEYSPSRRRTN